MTSQEWNSQRQGPNWDDSPKGWRERRKAVKFALGELKAALNDLGLQEGDLVLVACSGGADSLALAALTAIVGQEVGTTTRRRGFPIRVGAVIVDHQLHTYSSEVAVNTSLLCRTQLVPRWWNGEGEKRYLTLNPVIVEKVEVGSQGGPEAAARDARYKAIDRVVAETGAKAVLFGHTQDDQAEQVLLGLARGSGARSVAGMRSRNGKYVRPLLRVSRRQIQLICEWFSLVPWHDPTNQQPIYLRNRIRLSVLPVMHDAIGPGVSEALARTAELLAEDAEALDFYAAHLLAVVSTVANAGSTTHMVANAGSIIPVAPPVRSAGMPAESTPVETTELVPVVEPVRSSSVETTALNIAPLLQAPTSVRRRALRMAAIQAGAPASDVNRGQVLAIDALVANWHGQSAHTLPGNVTVSRKHGMLVFSASQ